MTIHRFLAGGLAAALMLAACTRDRAEKPTAPAEDARAAPASAVAGAEPPAVTVAALPQPHPAPPPDISLKPSVVRGSGSFVARPRPATRPVATTPQGAYTLNFVDA